MLHGIADALAFSGYHVFRYRRSVVRSQSEWSLPREAAERDCEL